MRKTFFVMMASFAATLLVPAAQAETLAVPDAPATVGVKPETDFRAPRRGDSQSTILHTLGEPLTRHAPVGGGAPKQPPITRWDYDGFSVFFERQIVIDVVYKDQPAPLSHIDELQAAETPVESPEPTPPAP